MLLAAACDMSWDFAKSWDAPPPQAPPPVCPKPRARLAETDLAAYTAAEATTAAAGDGAVPVQQQPRPFDLLLRGGTIVDGTGSPRVHGYTVGVRDGLIAAIAADDSSASWQAAQEIDCTNLVVAPGFIDVHTHDDNSLLKTPLMEFKISQGITTVCIGNCGISLAPFAMPEGVAAKEAIPPQNLLGDRFDYSSVSSFFDALDAQPAAINSVALCGHTTLRIMAMGGTAAMERAANAQEILQMQQMLREALDAGALGMSTGLAYASAAAATTAEVVALAQLLHPAHAIYTTVRGREQPATFTAIICYYLVLRSYVVGCFT